MLSSRLRSKRPRMIVSISEARRTEMDYEPRTLEVMLLINMPDLCRVRRMWYKEPPLTIRNR